MVIYYPHIKKRSIYISKERKRVNIMASTEAQKEANKRYREKHKPVQITIQYKSDKNEGLRLKQYLSDNNLAANQYVKMLIKRDLDSKGISYPSDGE